MIIKSMSRKAPTFRQLISYIEAGAAEHSAPAFSHNLYGQNMNTAQIADQFFQNFQHLPKRVNGNALLHEVIVLEPQDHLTKPEQIEALHRLAHRYCETRAPHQLAWGKVHLDTEFPHLHLMISANNLRSPRRVRLAKAEFAKIQKELEVFKTQELPHLKDRIVYQDRDNRQSTKTKSAEGEMVRRTGQPSKKQQVKSVLSRIFQNCRQTPDLNKQLHKAGFELYKRGNTNGVVDLTSGKKYRLSTLGLEQDYARAIERGETHKPTQDRSIMADESRLAGDDRAKRLAADRAALRAQLERSAEAELDGLHHHNSQDDDLER